MTTPDPSGVLYTTANPVAQHLLPGQAFFRGIHRADAPGPQVAFIIREHTGYLAALPPLPQIAVRGGLFQDRRVILGVIILHAGTQHYELWQNPHNPDQQPDIRRLAHQADLQLIFFDDACAIARQIQVPNGLQSHFQALVNIAEIWPAWTLQQWDHAREKLYRRFPGPLDLWQTLATPRPPIQWPPLARS